MGKYSSQSRSRPGPDRNQVPPLVRGIGCITFVLVPAISYGIADFVVRGPAAGWGIPPEWLGPPAIPSLLLALNGLTPIWNYLLSVQNLTANLIFAVAITIIIGGFMAIVYGYVYAMFGPSKYGPQDVPPPRVKTKKYTR